MVGMDDIEEQLREAASQWIEAGGSQNQLAKAAGVSQSSVNDFMRGAGLRLEAAGKLAAAIGRPLQLGKRKRVVR